MATKQQETTFERCLREFKDSLSPEERKWWADSTLADLEKTIAAIQQKQESTRTQQGFRRIQGFLEAMKANAAIIEVFLNVHPFVAFIWGPMKFIIQVASTSATAFNTVLEAYQRIGEHMPLFAQYQSLFESQPSMKHILELNFQDILEFHRHALKFFRRSTWRKTLDGLWKNFETKFQRILDNMEEHRLLLERNASLAEFEQAKAARVLAEAKFESFEEEKRLRKKEFLIMWLAVTDLQADQEMGQLARQGNPASGKWLWSKNRFQSWFDPASYSTPMLWIHGKPGAGKTVLASHIIDEASRLPGAKVVYFYCHDDGHHHTFTAMARSFLSQVLRFEDSVLVDLYHCAQSDGISSLGTRKSAESILDTCLADVENYYIVVDGLDECPEHEQKAMTSWLRKFVDASSAKPNPSRCLVLSQHDAVTRSHLVSAPALEILPTDNKHDILGLCEAKAALIASKFDLPSDAAKVLAETTADRADGMFLFAKLVMQNLLDQTSLAGLHEEMSPDIFPRGLDQAYSRITRRILNDDRPAYQKEARRLLTWTVCAVRPMKWKDVQAAAAIDVDSGIVDMMNRRSRVGYFDLCSPLVEAQSNSTLKLVHSSAKSFLISHCNINPTLGHLSIATKCMDYLCFDAFTKRQPISATRLAVLDGTYAFSTYAFVSWAHHLLRAYEGENLANTTDQCTGNARSLLIESFDAFLDTHYRQPQKKTKVPKSVVACVKALRRADLYEKLIETLGSVVSATSHEVRELNAFVTLELFDVIPKITAQLEELAIQPEHQALLHDYYGDKAFKCPRLYCDWYMEGFRTSKERDDHVQKHERSFYCEYSGCLHARIGCVTKAELDAHIAAYHSTGSGEDEFPPETSSQTLKRKVPATFECNLCPKKFTRNHNLRSHLRTHADERPFACSICNKRFFRKHDCKVHEQNHGEKKFVCGGLLKMVNSEWGCGKAFLRAKGLQKHLESDEGKVCIQPLRDEELAERGNVHPDAEPQAGSDAGHGPTLSAEYLPNKNLDDFLPSALLEQYPELADAQRGSSTSGTAYESGQRSEDSDSAGSE